MNWELSLILFFMAIVGVISLPFVVKQVRLLFFNKTFTAIENMKYKEAFKKGFDISTHNEILWMRSDAKAERLVLKFGEEVVYTRFTDKGTYAVRLSLEEFCTFAEGFGYFVEIDNND